MVFEADRATSRPTVCENMTHIQCTVVCSYANRQADRPDCKILIPHLQEKRATYFKVLPYQKIMCDNHFFFGIVRQCASSPRLPVPDGAYHVIYLLMTRCIFN